MSSQQSRKLSDHNQSLWVAYRHDLRIRNLSTETASNYFQALQNADRFFGRDFTALSKFDLTAYVAEMLDGLSPATVRTYFIGLKIFYGWLVKEGLMPSSPMASIQEPQVPDRAPVIASEADLKALLKSCGGTTFRDRRDNALFRLMLEPGGPRRREITSLKVSSLDQEQSLVKLHGKGDGIRFVPYGSSTAQALFRYLIVREKHKHSSADDLWLGRFGPLTYWAIGQILEVRCQQAGIPRIKPHGLRHSAADRWFSADGSENDAMILFGWKSRSMLAVYGRANAVQRAQDSARRKSLGDKL